MKDKTDIPPEEKRTATKYLTPEEVTHLVDFLSEVARFNAEVARFNADMAHVNNLMSLKIGDLVTFLLSPPQNKEE